MHVDLLQRAKLSLLKWWAGSTGRKAVARALWGQLTDILFSATTCLGPLIQRRQDRLGS